METNTPSLNDIQKFVWEGEVPLQIVLAPSESRVYDQSEPYFVRAPSRLNPRSYSCSLRLYSLHDLEIFRA